MYLHAFTDSSKNFDTYICFFIVRTGSNKLYVGKAQRKAERKDHLVYTNKDLLNYHTQKLKASNLFVKNLNITIDDRKLEQIFGAYGKVTSARVMRHDNGFSKGFGFVNFSTVEEAMTALDSLNGNLHILHTFWTMLI